MPHESQLAQPTRVAYKACSGLRLSICSFDTLIHSRPCITARCREQTASAYCDTALDACPCWHCKFPLRAARTHKVYATAKLSAHIWWMLLRLRKGQEGTAISRAVTFRNNSKFSSQSLKKAEAVGGCSSLMPRASDSWRIPIQV